MVRQVTEDEVRRLLTMKDALRVVERAFRDRAAGQATDTPRTRSRSPLGTLHVMHAAAPALGVAGFKAYYVRPEGHTYLVGVVDAVSGTLQGLIDAQWLGAMRTGAASGVATRALARADCMVLGCIGAGLQMATQIEAVCAVRPIRTVRVFARTDEKLRAFCKDMSAKCNIDVEPVASAAEAVAAADVVNIITRSSPLPVLEGALLEPGMHVNAAGVNRLDHRELDAAAVERADVIVVDSVETARHESGDLLPAIESGALTWESVPDLGDVLAGRHPGRASEEDITLFKSHGMALQDLYAAHHILQQAST